MKPELKRISIVDRGISAFLAACIGLTQANLAGLLGFIFLSSSPQTAQAARLGTSPTSAGSAPPPSATTVDSFQPDLFTGRASTGVPIAIPPGRKGVQPSLALGYSSATRNGWLGVGWNLDMGFIERSSRKGVPQYNSTDTFALFMQNVSSELVKLGDGTYRVKDEGPFVKITSLGDSGWEVRDKSAMRYIFGQTAASRIASGTNVFRWALDKVVDANGNSMTITYSRFDNLLYLAAIQYTGSEAGLTPANRVDFTLEDRPDIESNYRSGFLIKTSKRLSAIETRANGSLASRYELGYRLSQRTGRSLLLSVQRKGTDSTTAAPPVTFGWQDSPSPTYSVTSSNSPAGKIAWNVRVDGGFDRGHENFGPLRPYGPFPGGATFGPSQVVDDHRNIGGVDVVANPTSGGIRVTAGQDNLVHAWTAVYLGSDGARSLTYDGGNNPIAVVWLEDSSGLRGPYWPNQFSGLQFKAGWSLVHFIGYHQHESYSFGLGAPFASLFDVVNPSILLEPHLAGDVDGNGISDVLNFEPSTGKWTVSSPQIAAIPPGINWLSGFGDGSSLPLLGDWNGDGRTDIALYSAGHWRFATSSGTNFQADTLPQFDFGTGSPLVGDFNGDGIMDLGTYGNGYWQVALGTGSNFLSTAFNLSKADVGGGGVPLPTVYRSVREYLENGASHGDGTYSIDPDGPGGQPPFNVDGFMNVPEGGGGGWTKLTDTVANSLLNTDASVEREYLYYKQSAGKWYRSPPNRLVWNWTDGQGKDLYGTYYYSGGGSFQITSSNEKTLFGVSGSSGGGGTKKCLIAYNSGKDPANAQVNICQDDPNIFAGSACQSDVTVYIREKLPPQSLLFSTATATHLTGDFNGDGITDIALVEANAVITALGDGKQFREQPSWPITGYPTNELLSADFNGDGLSDLAFYNRSSGMLMVGFNTNGGFAPLASLSPSLTFDPSQRTLNDQVQIADFNGDSLPDPAIFNPVNGKSSIAFSQGGSPDLLTGITNGVGGVTAISYAPANSLGQNFLPFLTPVVTQTRASDGLGNSYTNHYSYTGGYYDGLSKEFRGFGRVEVRDAEGNVAVTTFNQDNALKGRPSVSEFRDMAGNLWSRSSNTWEVVQPYPGTDANFVRLAQSDNFTFDGTATFRQTRSRSFYDAYGNITTNILDGEVSVIGDERSTVTAYTLNTNDWILNRPAQVKSLDADGKIVAHRRFYYDNAPGIATPPMKGNLTREEEWLDRDRTGPQDRWIPTTMTYDGYGNVLTVTDALNHSVTNTFDASATFLVQVANPLGHTRTMVYDPRFGHVTSSTDANAITTASEYDPLGRPTKVIGPLDNAVLPTTRYEYDLSSNPVRVTQYTRVKNGQAKELVTHTFTDGLGRTIQVRSPAQNPAKQVVTGTVEFDSKGRVVRQWTPYLDDTSASYRPHTLQAIAPSLASPVVLTYDPLGRLLTTTDPDGSSTSVAYDHWTVTTTDAKQQVKKRTSDAFGRLVQVQEFQGTGANIVLYATTTYQYDSRDNLVLLTDAAGNTTTLQYDSLNRKFQMTDPDMGTWSYAYDDVDKLAAQTDARGVSILFSYDALNRQTRKEYQIPLASGVPTNQPPVIYTYDNPAKQFSKGKLTEITDASGSSSFGYDTLGRLVIEQKAVDGTAYTIQRAYDLLGRLTTLSYPNNDVVAYTYNDQGGIETVTLQSQGQPVQPIINAVGYNAAGQIIKMVYGNGVTTDYSYNPQTLRLQNLKSVGPGGVIQDFTYNFDAVGNVQSIADAVHTASQTFTYDELNRLKTASGARYGNFTYAHNQIGNMTGKEGVTQNYGPLNNKPHAVTSTSSGLALTYDANGNLASKSGPNRPTQTLVFDAENRLIEVGSPTPYRKLDPGWNFVSFPQIVGEVPVAVALTNFAGNCEQLTRFNTRSNYYESFNLSTNQFNTVSATNGYALLVTNAAGIYLPLGDTPALAGPGLLPAGTNLLAGPPDIMSATNWLAGLVLGVDYDQVLGLNPNTGATAPVTTVRPGEAYYVRILRPANWTPPTAARIANPSTVRFVYDGDGGRVKKITWKGTTLFLGQSCEISEEGQMRIYVFAGSMRIAAREANGSFRIYHSDHLGSANVITDQTGSIAEVTENTPYGSTSRQEGNVSVAHKFTGQRLDDETGLYFFNARYYDPEIGRFIQPDTIVPNPFQPQDLNRYTYAKNNPLAFVDPSGHFSFGQIFSTVLQVVGVALAPFTGGASMWLAYAGMAFSGIQAAQAGQFGAWAAGFGASILLGGVLPVASFSNLGMQIAVNAARGAAIGAFAGGIAALAGGGSFESGAGQGAFGGAVGGATSGFFGSQQYGNLAKGHGFRSNEDIQNLAGVKPPSSSEGTPEQRSLNADVGSGANPTADLGKSQSPASEARSVESRTVRVISRGPLEDTRYTPKVDLQRMPNPETGSPNFHGFPNLVENYAVFGKQTTIIGADGAERTMIQIHGVYRGRQGNFEFIIEQDRTVNHRFFNPERK